MQFEYSLLPVSDVLIDEVRKFDTHVTMPIEPPPRLVSGVSTAADRVVTVHCNNIETRDVVRGRIVEVCGRGEIDRVIRLD